MPEETEIEKHMWSLDDMPLGGWRFLFFLLEGEKGVGGYFFIEVVSGCFFNG